MKKTYAVGDSCWIYGGNHDGEKTAATVVHVFSLPDWVVPQHYVVQMESSIDPILAVRNAMTMAATEDEDIGLWALVRGETPRT